MRFILALLLLFVSSPGFADNKTWVGYKKTSETGLPFADMIERVTFELVHVGGTHTKVSDFEIVDTGAQKRVTKEATLNKSLRAFQIETCRRQKLKKCPVAKFFSYSTTFIEDGKTLNFCRHSVQNWLMMATSLNEVSIMSVYPPMMIKNSKGRVIYNTAYSKAIPAASFLNPEPRINVHIPEPNPNKKLGKYFGISDYVVYQFGDIITEPVRIIRVPTVSSTDMIYVSGYPAKTKHFGGTSKGDAPGNTLVTSSGNLVDSRAVFYQTSNFFYSGNSGGPVFNQNGELIAMSCMGDETGGLFLQVDRSALEATWKEYLFLLK